MSTIVAACQPNEWPVAIFFSVASLAAAGAYVVFRVTGGRHNFEVDRDRDERGDE